MNIRVLPVIGIAFACCMTSRAQSISAGSETIPAWASSIQNAGPFQWDTPPDSLSLDGNTYARQTQIPAGFTLTGTQAADIFYQGGSADWVTSVGFTSGTQSQMLWDGLSNAASPVGYRFVSALGDQASFSIAFTTLSYAPVSQGDASRIAYYTYIPQQGSGEYFFMTYDDGAAVDRDTNDRQIFGYIPAQDESSGPSIPEPASFAMIAGILAFVSVLRMKMPRWQIA